MSNASNCPVPLLGQVKEEADELDELTQLQQQLEAVGLGDLNNPTSAMNLKTTTCVVEEGGGVASSGATPHYMQPNFSSILPEYVNTEVDVIRNAFTTGNYQSIQKIPAKVVPNAINQSRLEQMETNRLMYPPLSNNQDPAIGLASPLGSQHCPKLVTKNGLFNQFEYTPSRYSLAEELTQMERLHEQAKRLEISGKDFVSAGNSAKLKYEDAFGNVGFRYPHLEQPYPDTREEREQQSWIERNKILHGAFVPSGQRLEVNVPTKKLLPDLLKELHDLIRTDWRDTVFTVTPTVDDTIVVRFTLSTVECESGLIAYMNVFCKSHWLAAKYQLHKVMDDWNSKPGDNGLYFVLRPPWARAKARTHLPFKLPGASPPEETNNYSSNG